MKMKLQTKLLLFGIILSVALIGINILISFLANQRFARVASEESIKLAHSDLEHIVNNIYGMSMAQNGIAQEMINNALKVSKNILNEIGQVTFDPVQTVNWQAVNQFTKHKASIALPEMLVGGKWLGQNKDMQTPSLIVDKTRELSVETCTIFQRMNEKGDMLRVCTNVQKTDGTRAIGTYIPAVNPDGSPNSVVSTVLNGETFHGRAFVVNAWYLTAYQPILDNKNSIAGILYVGIKQHTVEKSLIDQIMKIKIGKTGYVDILNSDGNYILTKERSQIGESLWDKKNARGNYYIRDLIKAARAAQPGEVLSLSYDWPDAQGQMRPKLAKVTYFKPWDWVIVASSFENEFLETRDKLMGLGQKYIGNIILASILILCVVIAACIAFAVKISKRIRNIASEFDVNTVQINNISNQFNISSQKLADGASRQAASIEETSASIEELSSMTRQNADNAKTADQLMKETQHIVSEADKSMQNLTTSMDEISRASEETQKIIKTIDEIAFQTNLLALNAAVEAARAGESGAGFAVVADEVRNLAIRAAEAARGTASLIEGTMNKISGGREVVMHTNTTFKDVVDRTTKIGSLLQDIAVASNEQAQGIEQINKAVSEMDEVTQQNAASAEESASDSEEMAAQAKQMKRLVDELKIMVDGMAIENEPYLAEQVSSRRGKAVSTAHQTHTKPVSNPLSHPQKTLLPKKSRETFTKKNGMVEDNDFQDF